MPDRAMSRFVKAHEQRVLSLPLKSDEKFTYAINVGSCKNRAAARSGRRLGQGIDGAFGQIDDAAGSGDGSDAATASGDQALADAQRRIERLYRGRAHQEPAARARGGIRG